MITLILTAALVWMLVSLVSLAALWLMLRPQLRDQRRGEDEARGAGTPVAPAERRF